MATLPQLAYLDLSFNNIPGSVPSFRMSKSLTGIDLSCNALTGPITSIHWEGLSNLVGLNLKYNSVDGNIPNSLFALPLVKMIDLSNDKFSDQLNMSLNISCDQLDMFDLSSNNLEGSFPEFILQL